MREKLKALDRNVITLIVVAILLVAAVVFASSNNDDNGTTSESKTSEEAVKHNDGTEHADGDEHEIENDDKEDDDKSQASEYSYVAQSGDSYTKIARKAVQEFSQKNSIELTSAQIIYAETTLTQNAGEPAMEIGETLKFDASALKETVDKASNLDETAEANWEYYVQFVDFNTDKVGKAV